MCTMLHSEFFYFFYFTCIRPLYRAAWSRCVREGAAVLAISVTHLHYIESYIIDTIIYAITTCTTTFPHERFLFSLYLHVCEYICV